MCIRVHRLKSNSMAISVFTEVFKVEFIYSSQKFVFKTECILHPYLSIFIYLKKYEILWNLSFPSIFLTMTFHVKYLQTNFQYMYILAILNSTYDRSHNTISLFQISHMKSKMSFMTSTLSLLHV